MALPATDSFTGSNNAALETYSSNWTVEGGGFAIRFNRLRADNDLGYSIARWNADTFGANHYAEATFTTTSTGGLMGLSVRVQSGSADGYIYIGRGSSNESYLYRIDSGSATLLAQGSGWSTGDTVRLEASGSTITALVNGSEDVSATDSTHSGGSAGVGGYDDSTNVRIDDWEGGDLAGGPASYDVTVDMDMSLAMTQISVQSWEAAFGLDTGLGADSDTNAIMENEVEFDSSYGVSSSSTADFETALSFASALAASAGAGLAFDVSLELDRQSGASASATQEVTGTLSVTRSLTMSADSATVQDVEVSMTRAASMLAAIVDAIEVSFSLNASFSMSNASGADMEASVSLGRQMDDTASAIADYIVSGSFARSSGISSVGGLEIDAGFTLSTAKGVDDGGVISTPQELAIAQALAISMAGGLTFEDAITLARQGGISIETAVLQVEQTTILLQRLADLSASAERESEDDIQMQRAAALTSAADSVRELSATLGSSLSQDISATIALSLASSMDLLRGVSFSVENANDVSNLIRITKAILFGSDSELTAGLGVSTGLAMSIIAGTDTDLAFSLGSSYTFSATSTLTSVVIGVAPSRTHNVIRGKSGASIRQSSETLKRD